MNKSNCQMAVCKTGNLSMLDCMLKGFNHLSNVHIAHWLMVLSGG